MTPEQAFDTGARVHLAGARMCSDAYGQFLAGTVSDGSHESQPIGLRTLSSYVTKELYPNVFLTRTGFTFFVDTWDQADNKPEAIAST